ncbi:TonB-dependent receptor [Mucilaginibacter sp.]|uniref:SusC/RagA family TonB-linked outer membrane protein n=1 Tax=Mucilaginibacter sp. TaxID=1882438 RepID=UPI00262BF7BB|nr:TonB-dependent receptor [Mucilaginibacter sp.]
MEIYRHSVFGSGSRFLKYLFFLLFLFIIISSTAKSESPKKLPGRHFLKQLNPKIDTARDYEDRNLSGTVLDENGQGLPGASIKIKDAGTGVTTDKQGTFHLPAPNNNATIVVSFIGYRPQELSIRTHKNLIIRLEPDHNILNDVVIVGYGTQKKKELTGSISSVAKENLNQGVSSADNLLQGAAPGIQVTQSSGQPGASATVRIRGGNSITAGNEPLYVIDGFPFYNDNTSTQGSVNPNSSAQGLNALATINPSDIESIEVLKDASATAIYGSRGANGVVIITTKKGKKGHNDVSYSVYVGQQQVRKKLPLLNGSQFAQLTNDIQASQNLPAFYTSNQVSSFGTAADWQSAAFRKAPIQNHSISVSGGDDKSVYDISGNYFDQEGVILNSGFKRISVRANYARNVSDQFKIGLNATGSQSYQNGSSGTNIASILYTAPTVPIKNADGSYNTINPFTSTPGNPIQDLLITTNETDAFRVLGNFYGEYEIIPGLKAKVSIGADVINTRQNQFLPSNTTSGYATNGIANIGANKVATWVNENTLTYNKVLNEHSFNVLVGYTTQTSTGIFNTSGSQNFISNLTGYNSLQSGSVPLIPTSGQYSWTLNSWLGRINYSFLHRYNFTVTARADGSSRFGANNKWGYFPSAGFSWNVKEEDFLKNAPAISNLNLRLSAGTTGNQEIGEYQSLVTLSPTNYFFNGTVQTGFAPTSLGNPDLKWETTAQYDVGVDLGLLDNRVSITADAYYKRTSNLLISVPVQLSSGYAAELENAGSVENKGLEIALNTENIKSGSFKWKTSANVSFNRNKVLSLNGQQSFYAQIADAYSDPLYKLSPVVVKVGSPLGTIWGYKTAGIIQSTDNISQLPTLGTEQAGDRKYVDINKDGAINANDKTNLGSVQPKFIYGFSNTFTYKNFDLFVFFQGSYGNKIYNLLQEELELTNLGQNASTVLLQRWTPTNPSNSIPRASYSPVAQVIDQYMQDGSYLRLKNISLGYNFSPAVAHKILAKQLRVYVSAQNLLTFTHYTGYDPEVNTFGQNNLLQGIDFGTYPSSKTFLAGLNITF